MCVPLQCLKSESSLSTSWGQFTAPGLGKMPKAPCAARRTWPLLAAQVTELTPSHPLFSKGEPGPLASPHLRGRGVTPCSYGHHSWPGHLGLPLPLKMQPPRLILEAAALTPNCSHIATFLFPECTDLSLTPRTPHLPFLLPGNPPTVGTCPWYHLSSPQLRHAFSRKPP